MLNRKSVDFGVPVALLVAGTLLIAATGADLGVSRFFFSNGSWPVGNAEPWHFLYRFGYYPCYIIGFAALAVLVAGYFRPALLSYRKSAAFLLLLLMLGPGVLVNSLLKDHWGRPRPREIAQFGGKEAFRQPWQRGVPGQGKSFPSGHAASAFYLAMPYFVLRRRSPGTAARVALWGMIYGVVMGVARMTQGGHFLSDILWAWGGVQLTAVTLYYLLGLDREPVPGGR